jgi:3-oxoacyl-[acyl-carrier protein] reductase
VIIADMSGSVCIVTGGGRGIGRFTAEALASRGARVAICARTESDLEETATAIEAKTSQRPLWARVDVAERASVFDFAGKVAAQLGPPALLVNNAATLGPVGPITQTDLDAWQRTLAVNVGGVAAMCAAVVPTMSGRGGVVNVSGGGIGGPDMAPFVCAYTASKAAVVALTESLAREFAPVGVTVNAVAPGAAATQLMEAVLEAGPARAGPLFDVALAQRKSAAPLEPYVDLLCYLVSERGRWLTGRLLSARWDRIEDLEAKRDEITDGSLFTLRRIDDALYQEIRV